MTDHTTPCACRAINAYDCHKARYFLTAPFICDDASDDPPVEPCECSCHDMSEDEYDDWCDA